MKQYKLNYEGLECSDRENQHRKKTRGFTLIEVLVSLLLVTMAVVFISQTLITGIEIQRKSAIRFHLLQELENCKNELNCKSFDDVDLKQGSYSKKIAAAEICWDISDISPTLKIIRLVISAKYAARRSYFFKSRYINNKD